MPARASLTDLDEGRKVHGYAIVPVEMRLSVMRTWEVSLRWMPSMLGLSAGATTLRKQAFTQAARERQFELRGLRVRAARRERGHHLHAEVGGALEQDGAGGRPLLGALVADAMYLRSLSPVAAPTAVADRTWQSATRPSPSNAP